MSHVSPIPHRRPGLRRARLVPGVVLVLALLGVTGCHAGNPLNPPAARVGGTAIEDGVLQADIEADAESAKSKPAAKQAFDVKGETEGSYRSDVVAFKLADRVRAALVSKLIRREKIKVTEEQRTNAKTQLCGGVDQQTGQPADCSSFEAYPKAYQDFQIGLVSEQMALAQKFAPELQKRLQASYDKLVDADDPSLQQSCFDVNAFQTNEEAIAAVPKLATTKFEELSPQYQVLGCIPIPRRNELPQELASIADGEVSTPLADPSGAFLLARRVDGTQSFEDFVRQRLQGGTGLTDEILKRELPHVAVQVDPRYGRWDAEQFKVVTNARPKGAKPPAREQTDAAAQASGQ